MIITPLSNCYKFVIAMYPVRVGVTATTSKWAMWQLLLRGEFIFLVAEGVPRSKRPLYIGDYIRRSLVKESYYCLFWKSFPMLYCKLKVQLVSQVFHLTRLWVVNSWNNCFSFLDRIFLVTDNTLSYPGELSITGVLPSLSVSEGENTRLQCVVTGNNVNIRWSR